MKISEAISYFEMNLWNRNLSESTIEKYKRELHKMVEFLSDEGVTDVENVISLHLEKYNVLMIKNGNKPTTRARKKSIISNFFEYCFNHKFVNENPAKLLHSIKVTDQDQQRKETLTEKEAARFMSAVEKDSRKKDRNKLIIVLFLKCAIRVKELTHLKWEHIDFKKERIEIHGKGRKIRFVPIFPELDKALKNWKRSNKQKSEYLFPSKDPKKPITERAVLGMVKLYAKKARIKKNIGCHSLRATAATDYLRKGVNPRYIQILLGHSNIATTTRYMSPEESEVFDALKKAQKSNTP